MRCNIVRTFGLSLAVAMVALFASSVALADDSATASVGAQPAANGADSARQQLELFAGMKSGDLEVKFIAKNDHEAQLVVKNKTKQPVSVHLPPAFAAVPALGQIGGGLGGLGGGGGRNSSNNNNQNQAMGGGMMGGGGGMMGGGMMGGGMFNIAPEAVGRLKFPVVCLEHGKKDPNASVPYNIVPVDEYTTDARVEELLLMFGQGKLPHSAVQAAAWHLNSKLSWEELAAKTVKRIGQPAVPYFSKQELQAAFQIAQRAQQLADARPAKETKPAESDSDKFEREQAAN